jgi:hypothetical protein
MDGQKVSHKLEEQLGTRSTEDYRSLACGDLTCDFKISCVLQSRGIGSM